MRRLLAAVSAAGLAACSTPAEPTPTSPLVATWHTNTEPLQPRGAMFQRLSFGVGGRFDYAVVTYTEYPLQATTGVASMVRTTGRYRESAGGALTFAADSLITSSSDPAPGGRTVVQTPYPYSTGPFDGAYYEVASNRLTLRYTSYPADAPVTTTRVFERALPVD